MFEKTKLFFKATWLSIKIVAFPFVLYLYKMKTFITPESVEEGEQ